MEQLSLFVHHLGRDPAEAATYYLSGFGSGPSGGPDAGRDPPLYRPDVPSYRDTVTQEELVDIQYWIGFY